MIKKEHFKPYLILLKKIIRSCDDNAQLGIANKMVDHFQDLFYRIIEERELVEAMDDLRDRLQAKYEFLN